MNTWKQFLFAVVTVVMTYFAQAEYIALTDAFAVEVFDNTGAKTSTINLSGSGAVSGANLISATYGNFRGNGNELIVLRDSGVIEYYADPLAASGSLNRLAYNSLEDGGRVIAGITTVVGGKNLAAVANPGTNAGTYGYEYDGSFAGAYLDRIATPSVSSGFHAPYLSLATGSDLNAADGQDWAFLGSDGWVEIFSDSVPGGAYERVSYFNAGVTAVEIEVTDDDRYAVLYDDNTVKFWSLAGVVDSGSSVTLDTTSTLTGFIPVAIPEPVTLGLVSVFGAGLFLFRRMMSK